MMQAKIRELEQAANRVNAEAIEATEIINGLLAALELEEEQTYLGSLTEKWRERANNFNRGEDSGMSRINTALESIRQALGQPHLPLEQMAAAVTALKDAPPLPLAEEKPAGKCDCLKDFVNKFLIKYPDFIAGRFDHTDLLTGLPALKFSGDYTQKFKNGNTRQRTETFFVHCSHCPFCGKKIKHEQEATPQKGAA